MLINITQIFIIYKLVYPKDLLSLICLTFVFDYHLPNFFVLFFFLIYSILCFTLMPSFFKLPLFTGFTAKRFTPIYPVFIIKCGTEKQ